MSMQWLQQNSKNASNADLQQQIFQSSTGMDNSMMQSQLSVGLMGHGRDSHHVIAGNIPLSSDVKAFANSNVYKAMVYLVDKKNWPADFAASWLGQAAVETGNYDLKDLDVVEAGSGAGRGMFQYTGSRR